MRIKSHLTKCNSKKKDTRESSAFYKHILNPPLGQYPGETFCGSIRCRNRQTEEGIFMINVKGELLNSKTEWHQPRIIRTTVHTEGAEMAGGRIVSFPVDGASTQAGGKDPQIGGGRGTQLTRSTRNIGR